MSTTRDLIYDVLAETVVDDPMWIGDDGQPLDYLPEREALIARYIDRAASKLAPLVAERSAILAIADEWAGGATYDIAQRLRAVVGTPEFTWICPECGEDNYCDTNATILTCGECSTEVERA